MFSIRPVASFLSGGNQSYMTTVARLHALYQECVNCSNTEEMCLGIRRDIKKGYFPRGFYFEETPVDVLIVAKNPGQPDQDKIDKFGSLSGEKLYKTLRADQEHFFQAKNWGPPDDPFYRNLSKYLSWILGVEVNEIFARASFTNLVKCSSIDNNKDRDMTDDLYEKTMENCFHRYLKHEVAFLAPKVILALGREVEKFLLRKSWRHLGVPVLYLKHPSYPLKRTDEPSTLNGIKEEINYFINKAKG